MKNKYFSLLVAFFTLISVFSLNAAETSKKKIAVVDFKAPADTFLTGKLIEALRKNSSFETLKKTTEGADYLLTGNAQLPEPEKLVINLQILNAKSNQPIYAKKMTITAPQDKLNNLAICEIVIIVAETVDPIKIDSVQGSYAILNRGEDSNLHRGMKLQAFIPNVPVIDPATNEVVKDSEYSIAELNVTEILPNFTRAQILRHSAPIEPGTFCRVISESECK